MEGLGCLTAKLPERKSREQLCPQDSWKGAQLQLGLLLSAVASLCAFPAFPLAADQVSPRGGVHSLGASASLHGTFVQIRKGAAALDRGGLSCRVW